MITYRPPLPAEWPLAQDLLSELAIADGGVDPPRNEALLRNLGSDTNGWLAVILALRGDEPLGIATFTPDYSNYRGAVGTYVADLYLRPAARGLGLGRGLLNAVRAEAKSRWGAVFVSLNVHRENTAAGGFYRTLGFTLREDCDYLILEGPALKALAK